MRVGILSYVKEANTYFLRLLRILTMIKKCYFLITATLFLTIVAAKKPTKNKGEIHKTMQDTTSHNSYKQLQNNTVILKSMGQFFEVTYLTSTPFPQIHIKPTQSHDGFLHLVRTDAKDPNLQCFIDAADPIKYPDIYPFYTLDHDFYDAPEWYYTADYKPLTFWNGHAWCVKIDKEAKTIRCCSGISWGFKFHSKTLHPKALPLQRLTGKHWKKDWLIFKTKFPDYQCQF